MTALQMGDDVTAIAIYGVVTYITYRIGVREGYYLATEAETESNESN